LSEFDSPTVFGEEIVTENELNNDNSIYNFQVRVISLSCQCVKVKKSNLRLKFPKEVLQMLEVSLK